MRGSCPGWEGWGAGEASAQDTQQSPEGGMILGKEGGKECSRWRMACEKALCGQERHGYVESL